MYARGNPKLVKTGGKEGKNIQFSFKIVVEVVCSVDKYLPDPVLPDA